MKTIQQYEDAIKSEVGSLKEVGINGTMFWAYRYSKEAQSEDLNFYDIIWDKDIDYIVETCRREGIERITISSRATDLTEVLWEFVKRGCAVEGMKTVLSSYTETDWETQKKYRKQIPAVIVKIN